jgi:lipoprotein-anchoring transpeptidase ErfK/SrfK
MQRHVMCALALSALGIVTAQAEPLYLQPDRYGPPVTPPGYIGGQPTTPPGYLAEQPAAPPGYLVEQTAAPPPRAREPVVRTAATQSEPAMGGGFLEFLFSGGRNPAAPRPPSNIEIGATAYNAPVEPERAPPDPKFLRQVVAYSGPAQPGTIVIDTPQRFLYLVQENGTALRYGIGVGKPGFTWAGEKRISAKKEWPDWTPPPEMLERRPDLPHFMAGGPENPLGARAMYLGTSLYRIHGSNEPWTIGQAVSSGCIRMRNEDVVDLYERVKVGTKVLVI